MRQENTTTMGPLERRTIEGPDPIKMFRFYDALLYMGTGVRPEWQPLSDNRRAAIVRLHAGAPYLIELRTGPSTRLRRDESWDENGIPSAAIRLPFSDPAETLDRVRESGAFDDTLYVGEGLLFDPNANLVCIHRRITRAPCGNRLRTTEFYRALVPRRVFSNGYVSGLAANHGEWIEFSDADRHASTPTDAPPDRLLGLPVRKRRGACGRPRPPGRGRFRQRNHPAARRRRLAPPLRHRPRRTPRRDRREALAHRAHLTPRSDRSRLDRSGDFFFPSPPDG